MKEAAKESEVKAAAAKSAGKSSAKYVNSVSSIRTLSAATAASATASAFPRAPNSTIIFLYVSRRIGCT